MASRRRPAIPGPRPPSPGRPLAPAWPLLVAILLAGFWLRLYHLGMQAAMGDDAFTLVIGRQSLPSLLQLSRNEPHPPLFYLLLHFWQLAAGPSTFAG
ncbi:MAG: hypothetical protein KGJ86_19295, partial [Chloroflexota bacterium]|nr:hypothetical protein [Chloroflexota bacterium]